MSIDPARPGEPEYLGDGPAAGPDPSDAPKRRRAPVAALAALGVVGVVGLGGWAALSLMSTGDQPASALPASTLAYASVDLDPSAAQKLEALRIVEKFPALDKQLGLDAQDDLRRWIFDKSSLASCDGVDYEADVAPWIGERAAAAVLPAAKGASEPGFVMALEVTDEEAAANALPELTSCGSPGADAPGFAFTDGYVLIGKTTEAAESAAAQVGSGSLADDAGFQQWTEAAGEPGIVTLYVAPEAPAQLMELSRSTFHNGLTAPDGSGLGGSMPGENHLMPPWVGPKGGLTHERLTELAGDFEGMAAVLRFEDGTVEMEMAAGGLPGGAERAEGATTAVTELPATTGAAFSLAFADGWLDEYLRSMSAVTGVPVEEMLAEAEAQSGLSLPEDAEALLGDSLNVAVDAGVDLDAVMGMDPSSLPVGVVVTGDPDEILAALDKVKTKIGPAAEMLVVVRGDGRVALGTNHEYVGTLAAGGSLGADPTFKAAVPDADRAGGVAYVNFEAGDAWLERLVTQFAGSPIASSDSADGGVAEIRANMEALEALGVSTWVEDGVQRGLLRLTTD